MGQLGMADQRRKLPPLEIKIIPGVSGHRVQHQQWRLGTVSVELLRLLARANQCRQRRVSLDGRVSKARRWMRSGFCASATSANAGRRWSSRHGFCGIYLRSYSAPSNGGGFVHSQRHLREAAGLAGSERGARPQGFGNVGLVVSRPDIASPGCARFRRFGANKDGGLRLELSGPSRRLFRHCELIGQSFGCGA